MKCDCRGFTTIEVLTAMGIITLFLFIGLTSLSTRPIEARSSALQFRAMIEAARTLAVSNASASVVKGIASGATVAVTSENGRTVARLYMGRLLTNGSLSRDAHVPPYVTNAEISVVSGSGAQPPFAIVISSSGYASLSALGNGANFLASSVPCPSGGYTLRFKAGTHTENHQLSCEDVSLETNN
jgi:Tfp pilus assembly protein FimT